MAWVMYGYPSGNTVNYVYNDTRITPFYDGEDSPLQVVNVNSNYGSYAIYTNVTEDGSLFTGNYTAYWIMQSNEIYTALDVSYIEADHLLDTDTIDPETLYYDGFSGDPPNVYQVGILLGDPFAWVQGATTYKGLLVQFQNATGEVNYNTTFLFRVDNYYGTTTIGGVTPQPDINPSTIFGSWYNMLVFAIGGVLTMLCVGIFMKAPSAWFAGLLFFVVGFLCMVLSFPSLFTFACWGLTVTISAGFWFGINRGSPTAK